MKKILAAFLALITISSVALVACKKDKNPSSDGGGNDGGDGFEFVNTSPSTSDTGTETTDTGDDDNTPSSSFTDLTAEKTVYVVSTVRVRTEPSIKDSTVKATVTAGTELTATAKSSKWYKVKYNNEICYVIAEYVTDEKAEIEYADVAADDPIKTLTIAEKNNASQQVNLRESPVVYDDVHYVTVTNKEVTAEKPLEILKKNAAGNWYIVKYDNKEYYVAINSGTYACFNENISGSSGPVGG